MDQEKLQHYGSLINLLYMALSTEISEYFRRKERIKMVSTLNYWNDEFQDDFNRNDEICEGIDNIDKINRHFEKTLIERYKNTRQSHLQQNVNMSQTPNQTNQTQQGSFARSFTLNNDNKKRTTFGQKSVTFGDQNGTNLKYYDSTVLHFSTTYDNTNNSAITLQDETMDSIDELNQTPGILNLDFIILPENCVYFRILDIFSLVSEKIHEILSTKYLNNFETERLYYEDSTVSDILPSHHRLRSDNRPHEPQFINVKESDLSTFRISVKGAYVNPAEDANAKLIKKRSNLFLHKFEKKLSWLLNNVDMNSPYFYDLELEQIEILEEYLCQNTSKVICLEIFDSTFEILLLVKKQIVDLCSNYLSTSGTTAATTRMNSPHLTMKPQRGGSISRDLPTPTSSSQVANNILKAVFKTGTGTKTPLQFDLSPDRKFEGSRFFFPSTSIFSNSFIFKHRDLFTSYLSIISHLIIKAPKMELYYLLNDTFISNDTWSEIVKLFTTSIFGEIIPLCDRVGENNEVHLEKEQIEYFVQIKRIIKYYSAILVMCNNIAFKEKLYSSTKESSSSKDSSKKRWKETIRKILQNMMYLIKPSTGLLANFLTMNSNINSVIINPNIQVLSNYNMVRFNLFKTIFEF